MDWEKFSRLILLGVLFAITTFQYSKFRRRRRRAPVTSNTPILLAYYTHNSSLLPAAKGNIAGLEYNSFAVEPKDDTFKSCTIIHIKLPYMTNVHLLGIPKAAGGTMIEPTADGSIMEEVILEGDYPSYFNLYADKGEQFESRYVLDPGAMWYTVEFCQSHNWEIVKGDLYFVQEIGMKHDSDPTDMWQDIKTFVDKIRPAIEVPNRE